MVKRYLTIIVLFLVSDASGFAPWRRRVEYRRFLSTDELGIFNGQQNETAVHLHFMEMAMKQAKQAEDLGEVPIGALIVERNEEHKYKILSDGYNLVEITHDASAHAELVALRRAAKRVKNWRLLNSTLYTTLEPCPMCLSAAQAFRVSSIVYGAPDLRLGAIETHIKLLEITEHPFHKIESVVPGILEEESASALKKFFLRRRKLSRSELQRSASLQQRLRNLVVRR